MLFILLNRGGVRIIQLHLDKYVFCLVFIYRCKTNRFIYHKKELIETCEYMDFDKDEGLTINNQVHNINYI